MNPVRRWVKFLVAFLLVGVFFSFQKQLVTFFATFPPQAQALVGTLTFSGSSGSLTGNISAAKLLDVADSSYYIDPNASGTSLVTAGKAGIGTTTISDTLNLPSSGSIGYISGGKIKDSSGQMQFQAGGTTTGSTGTGSITFLDSSGNKRARFDTAPTGTGGAADGALTVTATSKTDGTKTALTASTSSGQGSLTVSSTTGFSVGDEILVIQMTGTGVGNWETKIVDSVPSSTQIIVNPNLKLPYTIDGSSAAQIIRVPNYSSVTVNNGGTLTADAWNGTTGGVIFFRVTGDVNVNSGGTITAATVGNTGGTAGSAGSGGALANGGSSGTGTSSGVGGTGGNAANGSGGAGGNGTGTTLGGTGGTGGSGTAGGAGGTGGTGNGSGGGAADTGGTNASSSTLVSIRMGGGGGGGGGGTGAQGGGGGGGGGGGPGNASGTTGTSGSNGTAGSNGVANGGAGGAGAAGGIGGGIIFIKANTITVAGTISATGGAGSAGSAGGNGGNGSQGGSGGAGCCSGTGGKGGGGKGGNAANGGKGGAGGSGGSIYLSAGTLTLGSNLVTALGASGGAGGSAGSVGTGGAVGASGGSTNAAAGANGTAGSAGTTGGAGGNGVIRLESTSSTGTTNPTASSTGSFAADSSGYGTFYTGSSNTSATDLAEYYVTGDSSIEAGDVVTMNAAKIKVQSENGMAEEVVPKGVLRKAVSPYDRNLIGIISTKPGVLMGSVDGDKIEDKRMLALAGRVPVKIDPDSPAIAIGDFLTSSDKPGMAKKATRAGYVVARALETWNPADKTATIEAFIQLTYYIGDITPTGQLVTKEFDTLTVTDKITGGEKIRGAVPIEPDSQLVLVSRQWDAKPISVTASPSYDTTVFITDMTQSGFTIHVGTPSKKKEELYWQAWW